MADENFNLNPVGSKAHTAVKPTIPEALLVVLSTSLQLQGLVPHGDQETSFFRSSTHKLGWTEECL